MKKPETILLLAIILTAGSFIAMYVLHPGSGYDSRKTGQDFREQEALPADFRDVIGIATEDPYAQELLRSGGKIEGIVISCPSRLKDQTGRYCLPAVSIAVNETVRDFVVDPGNRSVVRIETIPCPGQH